MAIGKISLREMFSAIPLLNIVCATHWPGMSFDTISHENEQKLTFLENFVFFNKMFKYEILTLSDGKNLMANEIFCRKCHLNACKRQNGPLKINRKRASMSFCVFYFYLRFAIKRSKIQKSPQKLLPSVNVHVHEKFISMSFLYFSNFFREVLSSMDSPLIISTL